MLAFPTVAFAQTAPTIVIFDSTFHPPSWTVNYTKYNGSESNKNNTCATNIGSTTTAGSWQFGQSPPVQLDGNSSLRVNSVTTTSTTLVFDYWSTNGTVDTKLTSNTPCVSGATSTLLWAHFKPANQDTSTSNTSISNVSGSGTYGGNATLTAKLSSGTSALGGKTVMFALRGTAVCDTDPQTTKPDCPTTASTGDNSGVATLSGVSLSGINAGGPTGAGYENAVSASFAGDANYNGSSGTGNLTVSKAHAQLSFAAGTLSQTYDANPKLVTVNTNPVGLSGVSISYFNKNADGSRGTALAGAPTNAGQYVVEASLTNGNYTATSISSTLLIAKKDLTVTANNQSITYGDALPANSVTYDGFVPGENATNLGGTLQFSYSQNGTAVANPQNAGAYAIVPSGLTSDNYQISVANGTLTVDKAPITIKANDASRYYDDPSPAFSYSILSGSFKNSDLANGDVSVSLSTTATSLANTNWPITVSLGGPRAGNYALTAHNGTLTILAWTNKGFFSPVDYNGIFNTVKNGSTVPLKFQVFKGTMQLTGTDIVKGLKPVLLNCSTGTTIDDIEELATGGTSLRYDTTSGQFIFNWQTPKKPNTCYNVTVEMVDGTSIPLAKFWLK